LVLLALIAFCIVWPILRNKLPPEPDGDRRKPGACCRWHKVKKCLYNALCCGCCLHRVYQRAGFNFLKVGSTLRVTLIRAEQVRRRMDLYLEVWSEPMESYPKNSRIHNEVAGSCSLGNEQLEIDWLGDEEEVVVQAVQFCGERQSADVAMGELRVKRAAVERYAREAKTAANGQQDLTQGSRLFTFRTLSEKEQRRRGLRFKKAVNPLVPMLVTRWTQAQGIEVPNMAEHERLLAENETLRTEVQRHGQSTTKSFLGGLSRSTADGEGAEAFMQAAIRFEIVDNNAVSPPTQGFRTPSFQDGDEV
jgi:hypothetical protein